MKKSSKRIPKSYLPKYSAGIKTPVTRTLANGNEVSYAEDNVDMGGGTQNIYNQNRAKSSMLGTNQKLTGNQYAQMGQAVAQGGMQAYQTSQTPGLSEYEKNQQYGESIKSAEQGVVSAINPIFGMIHSGVTAATAPLTAKATQTDEQGNLKNKNFAKADIIGQGFADPMAMIPTMISNKFSMKKYINSVEDNAKGKIAAQKAQEDAYAQQQAAYQQQQNDYINNAIQAGMASYQNQPQGTYIQYPNGGMSMQPNAEIEKQENVVDPNGSFLQVDGSTHENGGVPVALPGNSMVFSDRLKLGKKTFAELNKVNNTNKEDKILESNKFGNTSKRTAELMKFAKNKNSEELFGAQEALKQAKVEAYAKKMGVTLPQAQEAPEEGMQYPMGGKLPMYPDGGPIDTLGTKVDAPPANYNFLKNVGNKQVYVDPGFIRKAPGSTSKSDPNNWNKFLIGQLQNGVSPDELAGKGYGTKEGLNPLMKYYKPRYAYIEPLGKPSTTPTNTQMPYDQRIDRKEVSQNMSTDVNYYDYPDANAGYSKATRVAFDRNSGREIDPMKSYDPKGNYTPYFNLETGRDLYKNTIKSSIPGTNPTNLNLNNQGDIRKEAIQSGNSFKYGGRMLPKYTYGYLTPEQQFAKAKFMGAEQNQRNLAFNQMTGNTTPGYNTPQSSWLNPAAIQASSDAMVEDSYPETQNNIPTNQPNAYLIRKDKNGKLIFDNPNAYKAQKPFDFAAADARQQAEIDAVDNRKVTDPNDKNFDWGSLAQTGQSLGNFALQNAGNIYDLTRKQDPLQKYARAKASFLDPSSAIRDALAQTRRAEYNIRNASGGNAGTYLANRVGLNAQNISMVDAIRQQYANANAGIANQNSQFNTEIAYREAEAQAKDRAMRQNVNSQAIHSMASNFGKASKASKENSMDQKELDLFMYRYKNEPGFKEQVDKFRTA